MADQVFDLTQTGQQVQDIINDANKVKGAGDQTTLTTESVLLKDINGNYHKILKSSFTEAIRDTLAGLLVNNDKGTTINRIAAIASGDLGSITPANLASVLGAGVYKSTNQIKPDGWYRILKLTNSNNISQCFLFWASNRFQNNSIRDYLFLISTGGLITDSSTVNNSHVYIQQIGLGNKSITPVLMKQIRIVKDGDDHYLDINFNLSAGQGNIMYFKMIPFSSSSSAPTFSIGTEIGDSVTVLTSKNMENLT